MELKRKYPVLNKILSTKLWGFILTIGVVLQTIGFSLFSYHSFFFLSGILFWSVLWWIIFLIFKSKSQKLQILINSVFISILFVESVLRITGIVANYSESRNGFYESFYHYKNPEYWINREQQEYVLEADNFYFDGITNELGYRDKEWVDINNETVVLALGDSFTEGDGADIDSTWIRYLERNISDTNYYFLNGGICGSDPGFEYYKLKHTFLRFEPDIVIICINESDIYDIVVRGGSERFTANGVEFKRGTWWEPIYAMSHLSRIFFDVKFNEFLISKNKFEDEKVQAFQNLSITIDSIQAIAISNSIDCFFVFHPLKKEVIENTNPFYDIITKQKSNGVNIINLYHYYQKPEIKNNIQNYYWIEDGHHNAKGYELMARGIYVGMINNGFFTNEINLDSVPYQ